MSDNYIALRKVLDQAYEQAATGKGAERHGQGLPFERQPMQEIISLCGMGFATGQAMKKLQEGQRNLEAGGDPDFFVREALGAINYIAGAIVSLDQV